MKVSKIDNLVEKSHKKMENEMGNVRGKRDTEKREVKENCEVREKREVRGQREVREKREMKRQRN